MCQHENKKNEMMSMMCQPCEEQILPKWKCVLRRCKDFPKYGIPDKEKQPSQDKSCNIIFCVYKKVYKCSVHNFLGLEIEACSICDSIEESSKAKKGTVRCRRELVRMNLPISEFMMEQYLPMMEKLCFHLPRVIILSKYNCGKMIKAVILCSMYDIFMRRDYANRLLAEFDLEI